MAAAPLATRSARGTPRMRVGALEARRWAGLVLAAGPDDGVGLRLAFVTPEGERRELDDWYWMVSRVGPHAPDGSYARVEFDLGVDRDAAAAGEAAGGGRGSRCVGGGGGEHPGPGVVAPGGGGGAAGARPGAGPP